MKAISELCNKEKSRSLFNTELKKVAEGLEKVEGRKVEFILRKILAKPAYSGMWVL